MVSKNDSFEVGMVVATPGVTNLFSPEYMLQCMARHMARDWGDLCDEDKHANDTALEHGSRLLSAYEQDGHKLYIITEADRSGTTFLLPEEY